MKGEIVPDIESEADSFSIEFLDDYFSECEEHLVVVRRGVLKLEGFVAARQVDESVIEELFRAFHSLKGISGMVGLQAAERLAHEMEGYLRALRQTQVALTGEGIDGLVAGAKALEQVIAARRSEQPIPEVDPIVKQLSILVPNHRSSPGSAPSDAPAVSVSELGLNHEEGERLAAAVRRGAHAWNVHFALSTELAQRGINVNTIRAQLQAVGELIHAAPVITAGGGVAFDFIVAATAMDALLSLSRAEGVTCTPCELPPQLAAVRHHGAAEQHGQNGKSSRTGSPAASSVPMVAPSNTVRVDLDRLDDLMRMVGELVISRARLKDRLDRLESALPSGEWRALQEIGQTIERQLRDLREGVMRTRMVPVGEILERMRFVVRDLARDTEKEIQLEVLGQETEIDKFLVERLMDPLLHLVRNAVSHGLESPDQRVAQGKPPAGRLSLRAATSGEMVLIEVEDDGRGIDLHRVAERARGAGLIGPGESLDPSALLDIICTPGFSTREEADRASGRGVGMSVVRKTIADCGGSLELQTRAGQGTWFTIRLPLTLAITDALIVVSGGQRFAVPQSSVREVIEVQTGAIRSIERNEIIHYRGGAMPLVRLARRFGLAEAASRILKVFVVNTGSQVVGIAVDRIIGLREIVVRALSDPLVQVPGIAGATELGDGQVVLILDTAELIRARASAPRDRLRKELSGG